MMNFAHVRLVFVCVALALLSPVGRAVEFAGGTGQWNDPYLVATAEQLISIGADPNLLDQHFVLVDDIDLDPNLSADYLFDRPLIGEFSGVLDGNGFRIHHLTIVDTAEPNYERLGLIEWIAFHGEVRCLILDDVRISAGTGSASAGAICSVNRGVVSRCSVTGSVSGGDSAGGLIGFNDNGSYARVEQCSSSCTVLARESGGLIGYNLYGKVQDCYASGRVSGERAGGLVGDDYLGTIRHCYAACEVTGTGSYVGGLIGRGGGSTIVTDSYFLRAHDEGGPDNGFGTPLSSKQMKQPASFAGWDLWGIGNDGLRVSWFMPEDGYPELTWFALAAAPSVSGLPLGEACTVMSEAGIGLGEIDYDYDHAAPYGHVARTRPYPGAPPGKMVDIVVSFGPYDWATNPAGGDPEDPYLILSPGQLDCLAYQPEQWDKHFKLIVDLDMAWRVYRRPLIGLSGFGGIAFNGTFDGNGHIIRDLTIEGGWADENGVITLGFFGEIGGAGSLRDLGLKGAAVKATEGVTAAGFHQERIGGVLCAINTGSISRCYSQGVLHAHGKLGGLVGSNAGAIQNCYAQGEVMDVALREDGWRDGGLVAENTAGMIDTCYTTCSLVGYFDVQGGLTGRNEGGSVERSLWDLEASGRHSSDGGTGLTTWELMDMQVLQSYGWGGNPNWILDDGKDYPRLIWEGTPGNLIPGP